MAARVCPQCNAKLSGTEVAAYWTEWNARIATRF